VQPGPHSSLSRRLARYAGLLCLACAGATPSRPSSTAVEQPAPSASEGFVAADDGVRLFYRQVGSGAQTVIVPASLYLFRDLQPLAAGRRVIFYDMRGRGRSDRVADSTHITIQWDVRDLESVRRRFDAERFTPIGLSYLGLMVMMYAAEHPDRVERVVQIGPVPRKYGTEYPRELTANDSVPVLDSGQLAELDRLRRSPLATQQPQEHCRREWLITRVVLVGDPRLADRVPNVCDLPNEWPANFSRHLRHHFVGSVQTLDIPWETFTTVRVPVLTIHGTKDRNAPYGAGREWASRLPDARLLTVPGAAHMPWIDQPQLVLGAIEEFLSGRWPPGAERVR
jgi:proline iminopeptidase